MDPSQDNFGSFAAGGTVSQFSGMAGGTSQQSMFSSGDAMSSGAGDIILSADGGGGSGKSRRGLVILLVVLVVVVIVAGVGFAVWSRGEGEESEIDETQQIVEEIDVQGMTNRELFDGYYAILVNGPNDIGETQDEVDEWYFERVINFGVGSNEEQQLLDNLKKYYDALWANIGHEDAMNDGYNGLFELYYNCANREEIVAQIDGIRESGGEQAVNDYISSLIDSSRYDGVLNALAINEIEYFENSESGNYLGLTLELVELTMPAFKEQTLTILRSLEMGDA